MTLPPAVQAEIDAMCPGSELDWRAMTRRDLDRIAALAVRETARECRTDLHSRAALLDPDSAPCNRYARRKLIIAAESIGARYEVTK